MTEEKKYKVKKNNRSLWKEFITALLIILFLFLAKKYLEEILNWIGIVLIKYEMSSPTSFESFKHAFLSLHPEIIFTVFQLFAGINGFSIFLRLTKKIEILGNKIIYKGFFSYQSHRITCNTNIQMKGWRYGTADEFYSVLLSEKGKKAKPFYISYLFDGEVLVEEIKRIKSASIMQGMGVEKETIVEEPLIEKKEITLESVKSMEEKVNDKLKAVRYFSTKESIWDSAGERELYLMLRKYIKKEYPIIPHVSFGSLFSNSSLDFENNYQDKGGWKKYHVDFVVYTPDLEMPLLGIELDGKRHQTDERQIINDAFKGACFKKIGIAYIRIPYNNISSELKKDVIEKVKDAQVNQYWRA